MTAPPPPVLVVGYGPVGQVRALLLARHGHPVTVVERWAEPYPMPRATVFDGETARTLAALGLGPAFDAIGVAVDAYDWRNADGKPLMRVAFASPGAYGWPDATAFDQPALEAALAERAAEPGIRDLITVLRGHTAAGIEQNADAVSLTAQRPDGGARTLAGSRLIGCDGANSFVRTAIGASVTDLGFSYDWLLCDVVPREENAFGTANAGRPLTGVGVAMLATLDGRSRAIAPPARHRRRLVHPHRRQRLDVLASAEAERRGDALTAAAILRSPIHGTIHTIGGHADPVATLTADRPPPRTQTWAERIQRLDGRLTWLAGMYRLPAGRDPIRRILHALPALTLPPRALALLVLHLADEDELVRGWLNQPPYRTRIPGDCPGCQRCSLEVTVGPAAARTVVCPADCRHTPDCRCPGGVDGVRHIWPRHAVVTAPP